MFEPLLEPVSASNPIVYLDIGIGKEFAGRVIIELRRDVVPLTAENFRALCTGEYGLGQHGTPLHYKGVCFHKVKRLFVAQSGDVVNNDGSGGESIYGATFDDENFELKHDEGVVSMANYGKPNTNNSQFVITTVCCENLNGTNVVVGKVLRGLGIFHDMEQNTTDDGQPTERIIITDCGEIKPGKNWCIEDDDETDDKLPPYPQDWSERCKYYSGNEILDILLNIRKAGNFYFKKQLFYEARRKYRKANRYYLMLRKRFERQEMEPIKCSKDELKLLDTFAAVNNLNMAAVELKVGEYANARYLCSEALRLGCDRSKALYRRGQAQLSLKNYEEAIKDLVEAQKEMPENKQISTVLNSAKHMMASYNRKQMNALKNLFV